MKKFILLLLPLILFGCGTDFYLNKEPIKQVVTLTQGDKSLQLSGSAMIENNEIRAKLVSDIYRGYIEIVYDHGKYNINYRNLPIDEKKAQYIKGDLYAAFYAGGYPFHSDKKMFGKTIFRNGMKIVKDTDGYELYEVVYNGNEIQVRNIVREYSLSIYSEKPLGKTSDSN